MIRYEVTCDHAHCHFKQEVVVHEEVGPWRPADVSEVLDPGGEPIITYWEGQPLQDAYDAHFLEVHADAGEPPMMSWREV